MCDLMKKLSNVKIFLKKLYLKCLTMKVRFDVDRYPIERKYRIYDILRCADITDIDKQWIKRVEGFMIG